METYWSAARNSAIALETSSGDSTITACPARSTMRRRARGIRSRRYSEYFGGVIYRAAQLEVLRPRARVVLVGVRRWGGRGGDRRSLRNSFAGNLSERSSFS